MNWGSQGKEGSSLGPTDVLEHEGSQDFTSTRTPTGGYAQPRYLSLDFAVWPFRYTCLTDRERKLRPRDQSNNVLEQDGSQDYTSTRTPTSGYAPPSC